MPFSDIFPYRFCIKLKEVIMLKNKKKRNRKIATAVVIALAVLIPAASILFVLTTVKPGELKSDSIISVLLTTPEGNEYTYSDEESFMLFTDVYKNAVEIDTPAHEMSSYKVFKLEIERKSDNILCEILMTDSPEDCLIRTISEGRTVYKNIMPDSASRLLTDDNFATAYTYYLPPTADVTAGENKYTASPAEMEWYYLRSDGIFCASDVGEFVSDKTLSFDYTPDKSISIDFELVPDAVTVQIFDGADSVYSGKYGSEEYKSFSYGKKAHLEYVFTVEWYESGSARYHGKATYRINVNYIVNPIGLASASKITQGEFLAFNVYNTADDEELTLDGEDLKLFRNNDVETLFYPAYIGGFIGQKTLSVSDKNGNAVTSFIEISPADETLDGYALHETLPSDLYVVDYNSAAAATIRINTMQTEQKLWNGEFVAPLDNAAKLLSYGTPIVSNGQTVGKSSFMLLSSSSDNVRSIGAGTVTFAGIIQPYGKVMIIDHGMGIASFYSNLDEFYFTVGDSVTGGLTVAKINSAAGVALQYGVTVNGYFIDPEKLNSCLETARLI